MGEDRQICFHRAVYLFFDRVNILLILVQ